MFLNRCFTREFAGDKIADMADMAELIFKDTPNFDPRASILLPLPTPRWGDQSKSFGAFTIRAISGIRAPADIVIHAILNTTQWPDWNRFHPSADVTNATLSDANTELLPGSFFTVHVDMSGKGKAKRVQRMRMRSREIIEPTEENASNGKGVKIVWIGKQYRPRVLRTERVHEIWEKEDQSGKKFCIYDHYETMSGLMAFYMRLFEGRKLVKRFAQWNRELSGYSEYKERVLLTQNELATEDVAIGLTAQHVPDQHSLEDQHESKEAT